MFGFVGPCKRSFMRGLKTCQWPVVTKRACGREALGFLLCGCGDLHVLKLPAGGRCIEMKQLLIERLEHFRPAFNTAWPEICQQAVVAKSKHLLVERLEGRVTGGEYDSGF